MNQISIVGAGAAGLMAAIQCAKRGITPQLYDSQKKIGKKILISGGGRCNITNHDLSEKNYNGYSNNLTKHILKQFQNQDTIQFFEKLGVPLKLENEFNKYFPESNRASDILNALLKEAERLNIKIQLEHKLKKISNYNNGFNLEFNNGANIKSEILIMATGGLSVPKTGSDGSGFEVLKKISHTTTPLIPALTPLLSDERYLNSLKGYSLKAKLTLNVEDKPIKTYTGPLLFTHLGFSGPVVLNISRHYLSNQNSSKIIVNWLPDITEKDFVNRITNSEVSNTQLNHFLKNYFSKSFIEVLGDIFDFNSSVKLNELSKKSRAKLLEAIYKFPLKITGSRGFAVAEATAGGIPASEIHKGTLESKIHKNLYFCGEMLDVDGELGGYNFQWAFASANTASLSAINACRKTF